MATVHSTGNPLLRTVAQHPRVELASSAALPTEFGNFRIQVFTSEKDDREQVAIVHGEVFGVEAVTTRIHSECLTGDVMGSLRCDCRKQLELGLRQIATRPCGVLLYLRQEGRGIGLANKVRAYKLQEDGLDTVDANIALGFRDDERDYGVAVGMLRTLGVRSVRLMTNNPDKVAQLGRYGLPVAERLGHVIPPSVHNRGYLETKARRSGHIIDLTAPPLLLPSQPEPPLAGAS
ncbi:MAG: GTP cyclohydrolase II [Myxococcota bacterium]|nr:GTP cyclohydrolase II [Myxococcota bacterium]